MKGKNRIRRYLDDHSLRGPWEVIPKPEGGAGAVVVVIPALAESRYLFETLASLAENDPAELRRALVICVINNRGPGGAAPKDIEDNRLTLAVLRSLESRSLPGELPHWISRTHLERILDGALRLASIDASSPGYEMPAGTGGVGMARKIGFDRALTVFDHDVPGVKLLLSLDADTLVERGYLSSVRTFFEETGSSAAVIAFAHRKGSTSREREAICAYETFLRYYVLGLHFAGSPYAFHSIGSTMAFTADRYAAVRGMNRRQAGEDFYYLNKMAKTGTIGKIISTRVHPSSRPSRRVPFGTGRKVAGFLGDDTDYLVYDPRCFSVLKDLIAAIPRVAGSPGAAQETLATLHPLLEGFLVRNHFDEAWRNIRRNGRSRAVLTRHFHTWFDGFRTFKFIRYLSSQGLHPVDMFDAAGELLAMMRRGTPAAVKGSIMPSRDERFMLLDHFRLLEDELNAPAGVP